MADLDIEPGQYPAAICSRDLWIAWILDGAERKRPVAPWKTGHAYPVEWRGELNGDERPEVSFKTAKRWTDFGLSDLGLSLPEDALSEQLQLGIILPVDRPPRDERIVLIDWDDVRDPETGDVHPIAQAYINDHGGYVEVSRSGEGLHQFVFGGLRHREKFIAPIDDEPFIGDDLPQVEIYDGGRHVAMTGDRHSLSGNDVDEAQTCIDDIVREYAQAELDAGHRSYVPETGATLSDTELHDKDREAPVPESDPVEYTGPPVDEFRASKPADRSLAYHAVVEAFCGGYAGVLNWRLEGAAAALGQREDRTAGEVINDLRGTDRDGGSVGYDRKTPGRVEYDHARAARDEFYPASWETLASWGVLPEELIDEVNEGTVEPVSALPLERLGSLEPEEARRYASRRGIEWPTTREARKRLRDEILQAMRVKRSVVLDAPTALGKSHTVATEPWLNHTDQTGEQPVIHLHETREARDAIVEESRDTGNSAAVLLGRTEACPVAGGQHDPDAGADAVVTIDGAPPSDWFETMCEGRGIPFSVAHKYLENHNDQDLGELPCSPDETDCPAIAQWNGLPRDEEGYPAVDVIHATHQFAHVPSLRMGTNLVFDERPDFTVDLPQDRVRRAVTAYLNEAGSTYSTFGELMRVGKEKLKPNEHDPRSLSERYDDVRDELSIEPPREWYLENRNAHTLAPALARAIFAVQPQGNNRYAATVPHDPPRLDAQAGDDEGWNRVWVTVVFDEDNTIRRIRASPDLTTARSVIGLDAHPTTILWQRNASPNVTVEPILDTEERQLWRYFERGLAVIQVGDATRPFSSGQYFDEQGTRAVVEHLLEKYGDDFQTVITASSVETTMRDILADAGVRDPTTMHFGEEKSRNDFGDEVVGLVNGCIDPGDDYVLDLLAEAGLDAEPETREDDDGEEYRAHGRGFVGEDADTAAAILASVREQHVAQASGRYARNAEDPEDRAVVFVRTDAMPTGFADLQVPGVEWLTTQRQRNIVRELRSRQRATTAELADAVDTSKEHVRKTLALLVETGRVEAREGIGRHGADVYRALTGAKTAETGLVDLTGDQITNDAVLDSYTWSLAIDEPGLLTLTAEGVSGPLQDRYSVDESSGQVTLAGYPPG